MKILWIVNTLFPVPSMALGLNEPVVGGWMYGLAEQLSKSPDIELAVATTLPNCDFGSIEVDGIRYYTLPCTDNTKYDDRLEENWKKLYDEFQADVVHIHGTEYAHGLACMRKLPNLNYFVSIQGLISVISHYYYAGMTFSEILRNITFRDLVRWDTLWQQKRKFELRGRLEKEYILRTGNIIGRTNWDYVYTKAINPGVNYNFCNESLRNGFYAAEKWSLDSCDRYTIFLSQVGYPIKGLHQVIRAVALLKNDFSNIKLRIGGNNILKTDTFKDKLRLTGYGKFIKTLLKKHKLEQNIQFLGLLDENQMIVEYQNAHVFICPSSIENSPNSLCEAQLLGVPVIASYVGGIPDLVKDKESGLLYRFEEVEVLKENIRRVFKDDLLARRLEAGGICVANYRHNRMKNLNSLLAIYNRII